MLRDSPLAGSTNMVYGVSAQFRPCRPCCQRPRLSRYTPFVVASIYTTLWSPVPVNLRMVKLSSSAAYSPALSGSTWNVTSGSSAAAAARPRPALLTASPPAPGTAVPAVPCAFRRIAGPRPSPASLCALPRPVEPRPPGATAGPAGTARHCSDAESSHQPKPQARQLRSRRCRLIL